MWHVPWGMDNSQSLLVWCQGPLNTKGLALRSAKAPIVKGPWTQGRISNKNVNVTKTLSAAAQGPTDQTVVVLNILFECEQGISEKKIVALSDTIPWIN